MLLDTAAASRASGRTRLLAYGPLALCSTMVLFGPTVAERVLQVLGCSGRPGAADSGCQGLAVLPASALAPWLWVAPPVETIFLLLQQTWPLLGVWLALVWLSMHSDRRPRLPGVARPDSLQIRQTRVAAVAANASHAERQAAWISQKQAEQAQAQRIQQLSLHRRMLTEGTLWGSLWMACIFLVVGLATFCLALGAPLIGGLSAESLLHAFGCSNESLMASNALSGSCGFWSERLEPYLRPWYGALFSPIWLFTQFPDVLLGWMGLILLFSLSVVYRAGWALVFKNTSPAVKAGALIMFTAALLGLLYQLSPGAELPVQTVGDSGLGGGGSIIEALFVIGAVLVLVLAAALVGLIVLVIALVRHFRRLRAVRER